MKKSTIFLTFEGPEGSGKSTQLRYLAERLRSIGREVVETREPGGTDIGTLIRRILLDPENRELSATAELLLMFASRAQNVDQCILPALASGCIVLSDRFTDSTLAYQGAGRGLESEVIRKLDRIACRGLAPDLTLLIDIDTDIGLARASARNCATGNVETRLDQEAVAFHRRVRHGFQELATNDPQRVRLIDGNRSQDAVAEDVWNAVEPLLAR
jgi:dTMP kinase